VAPFRNIAPSNQNTVATRPHTHALSLSSLSLSLSLSLLRWRTSLFFVRVKAFKRNDITKEGKFKQNPKLWTLFLGNPLERKAVPSSKSQNALPTAERRRLRTRTERRRLCARGGGVSRVVPLSFTQECFCLGNILFATEY